MYNADLIVIGAGPAGMSAAHRAAELGLGVLILDEQPAAGGQIYRNVERASAVLSDILGKDYTQGLTLTAGLQHKNITHLKGAVVWQIEDGTRVAFTRNGAGALAVGCRILLATGALERPMPVPGWTLPGVMAAGAAQILLKQSGIACKGAVLVGSGPLLYLIATQMVRAGVPPLALIETQTTRDLAKSMRHLGEALRGWPYLVKGLRMLWELRRAGIARHVGATGITIEGDQSAQAVTFDIGKTAHRINVARCCCTTASFPTRKRPAQLTLRICGMTRKTVLFQIATHGGARPLRRFISRATGQGSAAQKPLP